MTAGARVDRMALFAAGVLSVALAGILARVLQLQLAPGPKLTASVHARQTRVPVQAVRGNIVDRRGRLLATTEFGYRVFVDPVELPEDPHETIAKLAEATGLIADGVGARIVPVLDVNDRRRAASRPADSKTPSRTGVDFRPNTARLDPRRLQSPVWEPPPPPIRYVRITDIVPDETAEAVQDLRLTGVHLELWPVRQYPVGELAASVVGKVGTDHQGLLGAEIAQERKLRGEPGRIEYVRDARGRPLWMNPDSYELARPGTDLRLTIDLELQRMAEEELRRGIADADAAGGRLIMLDAATGEIVAMCDVIRLADGLPEFPFAEAKTGAWTPPASGTRFRVIHPDPGRSLHAALGRNRCVEDVYEPGSAFKPFVWSTVTELGKASPDEVFNTERGKWRSPRGRYLEDVTVRDFMTWTEVLLNSSNIGMVKGTERVSFKELHDGIRRFGFGTQTGVGLPGESAGLVTPLKAWTHQTQTSVSFGAEVAVTPVQMVRAFSVFARTGVLSGTLPPVRLVAPGRSDPAVTFAHRVVDPATAQRVRDILAQVALKMEALMAPKETGWRYPIFGKSGTAKIALGKPPPGKRIPPGHKGYFERQYLSSFLAAGPTENPRLVLLVIIDDPGPSRVNGNTYYGSHVAGPVVRRLVERSLAYLGVAGREPHSLAHRQ